MPYASMGGYGSPKQGNAVKMNRFIMFTPRPNEFAPQGLAWTRVKGVWAYQCPNKFCLAKSNTVGVQGVCSLHGKVGDWILWQSDGSLIKLTDKEYKIWAQ
tara:strand:- start:1297 stop:1599 length:303 start_codon:yes stop_codon:yes gene_type:complete